MPDTSGFASITHCVEFILIWKGRVVTATIAHAQMPEQISLYIFQSVSYVTYEQPSCPSSLPLVQRRRKRACVQASSWLSKALRRSHFIQDHENQAGAKPALGVAYWAALQHHPGSPSGCHWVVSCCPVSGWRTPMLTCRYRWT